MSAGFRRSALALLVLVYLGATLPWLDRYPIVEAAQCGIAAPAWKLASTGVYGNDLYEGFHGTERRNYEYMPLYPMTVAASYRLLGPGVVTGRLVSVAAGVAVVLLTYVLGAQILGAVGGLASAAALVLVRLAPANDVLGVPLLDLARVLRYDIFVPPFVLAACLALLCAERNDSSRWYGVAGLFAGLATLSHLYGAFVLPLLVVTASRRKRATAWIAVGFTAALLPWALYVLTDVPSFLGQMTRHEERFELLRPGFYLSNLARERFRYHAWLYDENLRMRPWRPGLWLLVVSVGTATSGLTSRGRPSGAGERLLRFAPAILGVQLALLLTFKRYPYVLLVLPFLALQVGALAVSLGGLRARLRAVAVGVGVAAAAEAAAGVATGLAVARGTSEYTSVCGRLADLIPTGSTVLGMQNFALGLPGVRYRALDLAFKLADPRSRIEPPLTFEEAVRRIGPDRIVFLAEARRSATSPEGRRERPAAAAYFDELASFLANHGHLAGEVVDQSYGTIVVYRVEPPKS